MIAFRGGFGPADCTDVLTALGAVPLRAVFEQPLVPHFAPGHVLPEFRSRLLDAYAEPGA